MKPARCHLTRFGAALTAALLGPLAAAHGPCEDFKWDIAKELELFGKAPRVVSAASAAGIRPSLDPGVLYELALMPQDQVHFAVPPGRKLLSADAYAGLATLHVGVPGQYRVALDQAAWIDVVTAGQPLRSLDHAGQHECPAPRKIVLFDLPAGELLLQLSGASSSRVRVTLTRAPPGAG